MGGRSGKVRTVNPIKVAAQRLKRAKALVLKATVASDAAAKLVVDAATEIAAAEAEVLALVPVVVPAPVVV